MPSLSKAIEDRFSQFLDSRITTRPSVRLNQRNIYILPSKEGLYFGILLLLMLLTAINYQNQLVYLLTFMLGGLFVVSMWICFLNLSGLELKALENADVFAGEYAPFRVRLKSGVNPHLALLVGYSRKDLQEVNIEAGGSIDLSLEKKLKSRGRHEMERICIETRFPFGLLVAWTWQKLESQVLVYPKPIKGDKSGQSDSESDCGKRHFKSDDVSSIRAYVPGDSLNRVSWKHFAARGELYSKEQHSGGGSSSWLSLEDYAYGTLEQKLSFLSEEIVRLDKSAEPFGLNLGSKRIEVSSGPFHVRECLRALALYGEWG